MVRTSVKYVPWKDYKAVTADLKRIYQSVTEEEALQALEQFSDRWDDRYPQISRSWHANWTNLNTAVPDRRLGAESRLSGNFGRIEQMEHAHQKLESGLKSFYD